MGKYSLRDSGDHSVAHYYIRELMWQCVSRSRLAIAGPVVLKDQCPLCDLNIKQDLIYSNCTGRTLKAGQ